MFITQFCHSIIETQICLFCMFCSHFRHHYLLFTKLTYVSFNSYPDHPLWDTPGHLHRKIPGPRAFDNKFFPALGNLTTPGIFKICRVEVSLFFEKHLNTKTGGCRMFDVYNSYSLIHERFRLRYF